MIKTIDKPESEAAKKFRLPDQSEWTFELIEQIHEEIRRVAKNFGLDTYPNQLEIITAEQMMDSYASIGMPISYNHWSYSKQIVSTEKSYNRGQKALQNRISTCLSASISSRPK